MGPQHNLFGLVRDGHGNRVVAVRGRAAVTRLDALGRVHTHRAKAGTDGRSKGGYSHEESSQISVS